MSSTICEGPALTANEDEAKIDRLLGAINSVDILITQRTQARQCPWIMDDGGRAAAGFKGNAGDCVARAVAIASRRPYAEVYQRLADGNASQRVTKRMKKSRAGKRTARDGISTKRKWFDDYMTELGFEWIPTMQIGQGCKVHLRSEELPSGRLVVSVSRHMVAVIDGVIHDTYNPSREGTRCVYGYYRLLSGEWS